MAVKMQGTQRGGEMLTKAHTVDCSVASGPCRTDGCLSTLPPLSKPFHQLRAADILILIERASLKTHRFLQNRFKGRMHGRLLLFIRVRESRRTRTTSSRPPTRLGRLTPKHAGKPARSREPLFGTLSCLGFLQVLKRCRYFRRNRFTYRIEN